MMIPSFSKTYDGRTVLDMPAITFDKGKIYAVLGSNGSGKSTLGRVLLGIEKPDSKIKVVSDCKVGYMPQKSFAFRMSLVKNINLNSKDKIKRDNLINKLGLLELKNENAKKLSGGETAKMALARLLINDYDLLILDEPTAAMDMQSTIASEELIEEYRGKTGAAIILVTHSIQQAKRLSDYLIFLKDGKLIEMGESKKLLAAPKTKELKDFLTFFAS